MKGIPLFFLIGTLAIVLTSSSESDNQQGVTTSQEKEITENSSNENGNIVDSTKNESPEQILKKISEIEQDEVLSVSLPETASANRKSDTFSQDSIQDDLEHITDFEGKESLKNIQKSLQFPSATSSVAAKRIFSGNESSESSIGTDSYESPVEHGYGYDHIESQHPHPHSHGTTKHADGYLHAHEHHKARPLKPSVVHRDPHASYDHQDKVRTLDNDLLPHHTQGHTHGNGYKDPHYHGHIGKTKPYHYDMHKIPECAQKNIYYYNLTFCLEDHQYPSDTILWAVKQAGHQARQLLEDVTYQSADNLVDGLTRIEEEGYTYKHYFGATNVQHTNLVQFKPPYNGYNYSPDYYKKGGYVCPSDIYYGRPRRAMNTYGKWKVIVNLDNLPPKHNSHTHTHYNSKRSVSPHGIHYTLVGAIAAGHSQLHSQPLHEIDPKPYVHKPYTQTLRLEQCIYPNAPCSYIDSTYDSRCLQKHNFVRLVAWTYDDGLHVDTFKMPIACSCHIRKQHYYHQPGYYHNSHLHAHQQPYGQSSERISVTISQDSKEA